MVWEHSDRNNPAKRRTTKMLEYFLGRFGHFFGICLLEAVFEGRLYKHCREKTRFGHFSAV
jgi:hypothetical protein